MLKYKKYTQAQEMLFNICAVVGGWFVRLLKSEEAVVIPESIVVEHADAVDDLQSGLYSASQLGKAVKSGKFYG